jgi:hypothetical protein
MVEEDTRRVFLANAMKLQEVVANKELQERYISMNLCRNLDLTPPSWNLVLEVFKSC